MIILEGLGHGGGGAGLLAGYNHGLQKRNKNGSSLASFSLI